MLRLKGLKEGNLLYLPFLISSLLSSMVDPFSLAMSSSLAPLSSLMEGDAGPDDGVGGSKYDLKELIPQSFHNQ